MNPRRFIRRYIVNLASLLLLLTCAVVIVWLGTGLVVHFGDYQYGSPIIAAIIIVVITLIAAWLES